MPKMNGYQVCQQVRSDPELKNIHIIMLTAMGQEADHKASLEAGADEYMLKPFSPRLVRERVAKSSMNNRRLLTSISIRCPRRH